MIPYGRQSIDEDDIRAVVEVLRSDWLTTGPAVDHFEKAMAELAGTKYAVAVSSGTAALHAIMYAIDIGPGNEVIVPTMTFASTANAVVFQGGKPVFTDVTAETLLLAPAAIEEKITSRTKAVIAVDYAGQPCDYDPLRAVTDRHGLILLADACHALGAAYRGKPTGALGELTAFSFHPVKHVTTGEGGMVTTNNEEYDRRMRRFRNHCITTDHRQRAEQGSWFYEMVDLGYNYRITDMQCALGKSQLKKLSRWIEKRQMIAKRYDEAIREISWCRPLRLRDDVTHAYHLYVIRLAEDFSLAQQEVFSRMRAEGIGVNVHYIPVHLHPYYRRHFATTAGQCPIAEAAYQHILSLPMYPGLSAEDQQQVIEVMRGIGT